MNGLLDDELIVSLNNMQLKLLPISTKTTLYKHRSMAGCDFWCDGTCSGTCDDACYSGCGGYCDNACEGCGG